MQAILAIGKRVATLLSDGVEEVNKSRVSMLCDSYLSAVLLKMVNANATMSDEQAEQVGNTIFDRIEAVVHGKATAFSILETYTLATYINSCK